MSVEHESNGRGEGGLLEKKTLVFKTGRFLSCDWSTIHYYYSITFLIRYLRVAQNGHSRGIFGVLQRKKKFLPLIKNPVLRNQRHLVGEVDFPKQ